MPGRKVTRVAIRTILATLLVAGPACGGSREESPSGPQGAVEQGGTLTIVGLGEPTSFNPKSSKQSDTNVAVMAPVWRGAWLFTPDKRFTLNRDLLTSGEMTSTDPQTVVYKINPNAVWSDGVPVTADDFIYNWETARPGAKDTDGSPIQSVPIPGGGDPIASVTGSDDGKTVTVVYKAPNIQWQGGFLFNYLIPAHVGRRVGFNSGFDRFDPDVQVSIGPYKIGSFNPGKDVTLVRNERYWGRPANLDRILFRFTTEEAGVAALRSGEGDLVAGHAVPDLIDQLRQTPGITTHVTPSNGMEYIGFNLRNEFLSLAAVRKAFVLALDRGSIVERVNPRDASVKVVNSFLRNDNQPAYRDTSGGRYDRRDVVTAKRLLEGAGFTMGGDGVYVKDGKRLALRGRTYPVLPHEAELQLVQAQVKDAGIELQIDNAPANVLSPQLQRGDFDVEVNAYGKSVHGTVGVFRPGNRWGYENARPNEIVTQSFLELDEPKRQAMLDEADRLLWDDLPMVPLYQSPHLLAVRNTFVSIEPNAAGPFGAGAVLWNIERWGRKAQR